MITINSYKVTEQAVYNGVTAGVEHLLKDVANFSKPEIVVNTITEAVLAHLCEVYDFGPTPIRLTPDLLRKIQEIQANPTPTPENP